MAAPVVTRLVAGSSSVATTTVTFAAQPAGTLLILSYAGDDYATTAGAGRPESTGWTQATSQRGSGQFHGSGIWYKITPGGETTVQYTIGSASRSAYNLIAASGIAASGTLVAANSTHSNGSSPSMTTPAVVGGTGERLAIALVTGSNGASLLTAPGTWLNSYADQGAGLSTTAPGLVAAFATLYLATGGSTSSGASFVGTTPEARSGHLAIFAVASGGGGFSGSIALGGSGTQTRAGVPGFKATQALSGAGTQTRAGSPAIPGSAGLSGSGTIGISGSPGHRGSAGLSGVGQLGAVGVVGFSGSIALSSPGEMDTDGAPGFLSLVGASGSGSQQGAGEPAVSNGFNLSGDGVLTFTSSDSHGGTVELSGSGTLALFGLPSISAKVSLSGTGSLVLSGSSPGAGDIALSGSGSLVVSGSPSTGSSFGLSGEGFLAPKGSPKFFGVMALGGVGSLTLSAVTPSMKRAMRWNGIEFVGLRQFRWDGAIYLPVKVAVK